MQEIDAAITGEIGGPALGVGGEFRAGVPRENPEHMGPHAAVPRGVGVAFLVTECMVFAVVCHPDERGALARDSTQEGKEKPHRSGCLEAAVREQTVIAEANAQAAGHPVERQTDGQPRPGEIEGCGERCQVHTTDPDDGGPVEVGPVGGWSLAAGFRATALGFACGRGRRVMNRRASETVVEGGRGGKVDRSVEQRRGGWGRHCSGAPRRRTYGGEA